MDNYGHAVKSTDHTKIPSKIGTHFYGNDGKTHKSGKKLFKKLQLRVEEQQVGVGKNE